MQAHEEGGEAGKGDHMGEGIGAPDARYVGEHVVVRALGCDGPLFVAADFFLRDLKVGLTSRKNILESPQRSQENV